MEMSFRTLLGVSYDSAPVPNYQSCQTQSRPLININFLLYKLIVMHILWCYGLWVCFQLPIETTQISNPVTHELRDVLAERVVLAQTLPTRQKETWL